MNNRLTYKPISYGPNQLFKDLQNITQHADPEVYLHRLYEEHLEGMYDDHYYYDGELVEEFEDPIPRITYHEFILTCIALIADRLNGTHNMHVFPLYEADFEAIATRNTTE